MIIHENVKSENIIGENIRFVTQATFQLEDAEKFYPHGMQRPPSRRKDIYGNPEKHDEGG